VTQAFASTANATPWSKTSGTKRVLRNMELEMMGKPKDADHDQIDGHDVVQQSRHDQNQNACNQCDERIKDFHV
jgi:hypothetical protein